MQRLVAAGGGGGGGDGPHGTGDGSSAASTGDALSEKELLDSFIGILIRRPRHHRVLASVLGYLLAQPANARVMQRLGEEQARVVATHGSALTPAALRNMP